MSETLGLSCPEGGKFYICDKAVTRFVGCCTVDPCASGTGVCPTQHLKTSSFSSDAYMNIPAQSCNAPTGNTTWFTCSQSKPPFMGCCGKNPCELGGCPQADLLPAKLSDVSADAQVFLNIARGTDSSSGHSGLPIGATVGIAVGGAVLFGVIAAFIAYRCGWFARRRREEKKSKSSGDEATQLYDATGDGGMGGLTALHSGTFSGRDWPEHERLRSENGSPSPRYPSPGHSPGFAPYSPGDVYNKHYSDASAEHYGYQDRKALSPMSAGSPFLDQSNRTSLGPDRTSSQTYGRYSAVSNGSYEPPYHRSPGHSRNPSDQTNQSLYPAALGVHPAPPSSRPHDDTPHVAMELEASQPQHAVHSIAELPSEIPSQHYR